MLTTTFALNNALLKKNPNAADANAELKKNNQARQLSKKFTMYQCLLSLLLLLLPIFSLLLLLFMFNPLLLLCKIHTTHMSSNKLCILLLGISLLLLIQ